MLLVIQLGTFENEIHAGDIGLEVTVIQGVFLTGPPLFSTPTSQPEAFLDEEFHGTAAPIG